MWFLIKADKQMDMVQVMIFHLRGVYVDMEILTKIQITSWAMKMQYHSQKIVLKHATHEALSAKSPNLGWKQYKPF